MTNNESSSIAIIGGGASGTLLAAHLLREALPENSLHIKLIERAEVICRGIAYGTQEPQHLLNVRAANMSAFPDKPHDFVRWLRHHEPFKYWEPVTDDIAESYAPRFLYGFYLQDVLEATVQESLGKARLERIFGEAVEVHAGEDESWIRMNNGSTITAGKVVLAMGNLPPSELKGVSRSFLSSPRYVSNPWAHDALQGLSEDEPVLLVGAGLTTIDLLTSLSARGHRGPITVLSRRGLLPQPHRTVRAIKPFLDESVRPLTARNLLRRIRLAISDPDTGDWRSVVNSMREATPRIWRALPLAEKRRFLRHLQTYWDMHRHRMAPEVANVVARMRSTGQLMVRAGRIFDSVENDSGVEVLVRERRTGTEFSLHASRVINCTGASFDSRAVRRTVLGQLISSGRVRTDSLGLGLEVDEKGRCIDAAGDVSANLYAIGPLRKGMLWESTAVPEIRMQAKKLARQLNPQGAYAVEEALVAW